MRGMPEQQPPAAMPEILAPVAYAAPRPHEQPHEQPTEQPAAPAAQPQRRRPNVVALALLGVAFILALGAQYLPWCVYDLSRASNGRLPEEDPGSVFAERTLEVPVAYLGTPHVLGYLITLAGALVGLAVALYAGDGPRRIALASSGGLLATNLVVLVGLKGVIDHMGNTDFSFLLVQSPEAQAGPGYLLAFATLLVLLAVLVLAARNPLGGLSLSRRRRDEPADGEPLELTVTPVPPTFQ